MALNKVNKKVIELFSRGKTSKLLVFCFHNIADYNDKLYINATDQREFSRQVSWIAENFTVLELKKGIDECRANRIQEPIACITLDDGYKSHLEIAAPILKRHNLPATFFVSSGHLGDKILWNDQFHLFYQLSNHEQKEEFTQFSKSLLADNSESNLEYFKNLTEQDWLNKIKYLNISLRSKLLDFMGELVQIPVDLNPMLTTEQLKSLIDLGFSVGGHTLSHPILAMETDELSELEIRSDVRNLQELTGKKIDTFAYPNGKPNKDYTHQHISSLIKSGVQYACSTAPGHFPTGGDPLQIPRIGLTGSDSWSFLRSVSSALSHQGQKVKSRGYETVN